MLVGRSLDVLNASIGAVVLKSSNPRAAIPASAVSLYVNMVPKPASAIISMLNLRSLRIRSRALSSFCGILPASLVSKFVSP